MTILGLLAAGCQAAVVVLALRMYVRYGRQWAWLALAVAGALALTQTGLALLHAGGRFWPPRRSAPL